MSLRLVQTASLLAATVTTGLTAGLFYSFACAVMPGLRHAADRTVVDAMQKINVAIINGWFMLCFLGALILGVVAALLHVGRDARPVLPWIIAGLVLYIGVLAITGAANIPLNDQLERAGDPDAIVDLAAVRRRFEDAWVTWNLVRAIVNTAAFSCLLWALTALGRATQT
jgi:uncharacterized membrane protein